MQRVAIYARVSTDEQAREGTSIETQIRDLRQYCENRNLEIDDVYIDEGFSGNKEERPEFQRMMAGIRQGRANTVLSWRLDRCFRKLQHQVNYFHELEKHGANFVTLMDGIDTSNTQGRLMFNILGSIAEAERENIRERMIAGHKTRILRGEWPKGKAKYGYVYNPATRKLEIAEEEAKVVRLIFHLYVNERYGIERLARRLNEIKIPPKKRAVRWHTEAVQNILNHGAYAGKHPMGIETPIIIEPALFEMAQKRRGENHHLQNREDSPWLLQSLLKCGKCGYHLKGRRNGGSGDKPVEERTRIYACTHREKGTRLDKKCDLPRVSAEWLEEQVWAKIKDALRTPESLNRALDEYIAGLETKYNKLQPRIQPIEEQLKLNEEKQSRLQESYVMLKINKERRDKLTDELDKEHDRLLKVKHEIDPLDIEELERTRSWLRFWKDTKKELNLTLTILPEDDEEIRVSGFQGIQYIAEIDNPELEGKLGFPTSKRQLLDYFQIEVMVYPSRLEINGIIPFNGKDANKNTVQTLEQNSSRVPD